MSKEVDCIMNMRGKLTVARSGSTLTGQMTSTPEQRFICTDINFDLTLNADISKKDSVLRTIREFKEAYQVWHPSVSDTLIGANIVQRKIINYVVEDQFKQRENIISDEIEVASDSLKVDFYDNGEVDGDSISVFFNNQLLTSSQILSQKAIHFNLTLDEGRPVNELSMFADNLGSIPPNTALMIVDDGKRKYEIRLTSTLQNNGTIRIKRKK
jgi:CMP-N-acetylneuraminic acid synthetase